MMDKQDKQLIQGQEELRNHLLDEFDIVASSTECTGLIPTPPISEGQAEAYTDIYTIPKPENDQNNGLQKEKKVPHGNNR